MSAIRGIDPLIEAAIALAVGSMDLKYTKELACLNRKLMHMTPESIQLTVENAVRTCRLRREEAYTAGRRWFVGMLIALTSSLTALGMGLYTLFH